MRENLLDTAEKMIQERGLNAVSFQHLADAVGLRKPSVFHHFKNKEALVEALIERCRSSYRQRYEGVIDSDGRAPEKLTALGEIFSQSNDQGRMCMLGSLSVSSSSLSKTNRTKLGRAANETIRIFAEVFKQGRDEGSLEFVGQEEDAATSFLAMLQGLQAISRATGDKKSLLKAVASYVASLSTNQSNSHSPKSD